MVNTMHEAHEGTTKECMTLLTMKLTARELQLLANLATDQLFRREFIDPKMPGHRTNSSEINQGKALVGRMRALLDPEGARRQAARLARPSPVQHSRS